MTISSRSPVTRMVKQFDCWTISRAWSEAPSVCNRVAGVINATGPRVLSDMSRTIATSRWSFILNRSRWFAATTVRLRVRGDAGIPPGDLSQALPRIEKN